MKSITCLLTLALVGLPFVASAQVPPGYPANYAATIDAAKKEGKVVVYSSTDTAAASPPIKDFEALYPGIKVEYNDMNTTELYNRLISEKAAGGASGDVLWSSSMDLQVKLANDGFALAYASPEVPKLPAWAVWKNEAYGSTYEPIVIVYNKRLLAGDEIPQSHADLLRVFTQKADKLKGKVTSYDIEKSGVGFLLITQCVDARLAAVVHQVHAIHGQYFDATGNAGGGSGAIWFREGDERLPSRCLGEHSRFESIAEFHARLRQCRPLRRIKHEVKLVPWVCPTA